MVMRMPPSKKDPSGTKYGELHSLFVEEWESVTVAASCAPVMVRYMSRFAVARGDAATTPLFRLTENAAGSRGQRMTQGRFKTVFNQLCRSADPVIQYKDFGVHCFRVGGMNRLSDLGASVPQICALGRWSSDCWQVYGRRHRDALVLLSSRMAAG